MTCEILNYKDVMGNPSIIGEFDLYMPTSNMTFHKLKVIRTKKGATFIGLPTWCEKLDDGTKKYHPYISFSQQKSEAFQKMVIDKLKEIGFLQ